ncbi:hypothetical protein QP185_05905 [Sphingomonas aerolata]|uniref:hypothetical protein n=1 Tax=Sphingomonas aerolata TaxID=185951 RepID=UPI002FE02C69
MNQSKIYVDEGGIGTELAPQMREQYNRYVQLLENPHLDAQADQINKILGRILEKTNTIEGSKFNADLNRYPIPSTERHGVLQRAFAELAEWFVTSPEFGLDAHLSSNIRHGTFLGHSRSPFLKRRLIIAADSEDNGEEIFDFWRAKLPDLTSEQMSSLKSFVGRFSSETNKLVDRVNDDIIRVRDGDHPNGLFKYDALADTQERLAASISLQTTFDEFMDAMFDMCWRQTESSMAEIREYLLGEFQEHIGTLLDSFELGIERSMDRLASPEIFDAIVEARTDFSNSIQRISEWFRRPNRPSDEPLAIDIVVDVAVKEVQSCFLEREFRPTIKLSEQLTIRGRKIDGCVEILFILFQNAIKHNYDLLDLNSTLTVDTDGKTLFFSFLNDLSPTTNHAELQAAAIEAQRRYNGEDALAKVRTEGGSGLSKIWRTAEHTMKVDHSVSLSVSETTFLAEVMLGIEGVQ